MEAREVPRWVSHLKEVLREVHEPALHIGPGSQCFPTHAAHE